MTETQGPRLHPVGYQFIDYVVEQRWTVIGSELRGDVLGYLIEDARGVSRWAHPTYVHAGEAVAF